MLKSIDLIDKSYDDMIAEAISQITLYSKEWTNFNVSDPGVTVLQNLTAFNFLQMNTVNEVTEAIRLKLLKLLHLESQTGRAATVLLESRSMSVLKLPAYTKLSAGGLVFETTNDITLQPWGIAAAFTENKGAFKDVTYLLDRDVQMGAEIFGDRPEPGMAFYCILSGKPEVGRPIILYARARNTQVRNSFEGSETLEFADVLWQVYTQDGWKDVTAQDKTHGFLVSGDIRLLLKEEPAVFEGAPTAGYALRSVLKKADYDLQPRLHSLTANLIEVTQKDTKAISFTSAYSERVSLRLDVSCYSHCFVYCREAEGQLFRAYREYAGQSVPGRYYTVVYNEDGMLCVEFDRARFGFGPADVSDAIHVVCYEEETLYHKNLGPVYGYDDQIIDIDLTENIVEDAFSLIVETVDDAGEYEYDFVRPGETDPGRLCYRVLAKQGKILVMNPGLGRDCRLLLCNLAVTAGRDGNIREENQFVPVAGGLGVTALVNPSPGQGGVSSETVEELRRRFVSDIKRSSAAVTAADYERIVKDTPGLCIHKVKAVCSAEKNVVKIAIKPYTRDSLSRLSPVYIENIRKYLEPRRMLTTDIELLQPKYIPINVQAVIVVKSYFENARQEIEKLLSTALDFVSSDRGFGEVVRFSEIFRAIEDLPCVDAVYSLTLTPQMRGDVALVGMDIFLGNQCLCYPGQISLELTSQAGTIF